LAALRRDSSYYVEKSDADIHARQAIVDKNRSSYDVLKSAENMAKVMAEKASPKEKPDLDAVYAKAVVATAKALHELNMAEIALASAKTMRSRETAQQHCYLTVFTAVYYARALDVSVFLATSSGARAKGSIIPAGEDKKPTIKPGEVGGDFKSGSSSSSGQELLDSVGASLNTTMAVPGGSLQYVNLTSNSVGLRRVFDRPMAIGYRGKIYCVQLSTGKVIPPPEEHVLDPQNLNPQPPGKVAWTGPDLATGIIPASVKKVKVPDDKIREQLTAPAAPR
jgi:hypothetical protein